MFTCPVESNPNEASFQALFKSHSLCNRPLYKSNSRGFLLHDMPYMESCSITRKVRRISTDHWVSHGPLGPIHTADTLKMHAACTPYPSGCLPALGTLTVFHQIVFWMGKALLHSAPAQQRRHSGTTQVNEICQDRFKDSTGTFFLTFHKIQS